MSKSYAPCRSRHRTSPPVSPDRRQDPQLIPAGVSGRVGAERDLAGNSAFPPSVREALIALKYGLVEVRIRSESTLRQWTQLRAARGWGARTGNEGDGGATPAHSNSCVRATVGRNRSARGKSAKKAQVQAIETLETIQHELDCDKQPLGGDRMFHIHRGATKRRLVAVIEMLWGFTGPLQAARALIRRLGQSAMAEHRAVLKAIAAKDAAGARAAMQRHLNQAYKRFSTGWDTVSGQK